MIFHMTIQVCGDEKLFNKDLISAFLRTRPPDSQMVESILALLQHYDWNSISVVVENTTKWQATALSLERRTGQKKAWSCDIYIFQEIIFDKTPALDCETIGEIRQMRRLQHDNINPFICATTEPARICIITEFQSRKSLMDALSTTKNDLNCKLIASLALELAKGMLYIHSSDLRCHGNLKSANCLLDSNWTLKIWDFGLHKLRNAVKNPSKNE
ncbi:hypothetical protein GHT06_009881 [Daphnia sinensis]|uniref:guanylate cyclase n=1 Tax=Daphnia sinensis TaxID=1820382 RepID=A0AAD5LHK0_9CRUS|nr:hypothetical protein GHT06_009881 [Daphnia sinensis]